jgi:flagellar biosynthetic protein FliR
MNPLSVWMSGHWQEVVTFMLVFGRAAGLIVSAPFWGSRSVPVLVRVLVALLLAVATYPLAPILALRDAVTIVWFMMTLGGEILFGLMLGWFAQLLFTGMRLAGHLIEMKSGLGLVQLIDPHEGGQSGVFSTFLELIAGLIFFSMNGHHLLFQALSSSYNVFPLAGEKFVSRVIEGLVGSTAEIFVIALRVSAPVVVGLLLSDIVLGILARAIPQMNVFMVAQPLQFAFGILLLLMALPGVVWFFIRQLPHMIGVPGGVG